MFRFRFRFQPRTRRYAALALLLSTGLHAVPAAAEPWNTFVARLRNGGAYVADERGKALLCSRCDDAFIPASTLKLATALTALDVFGRDHRFETRFSMRDEDTLVVHGSGDPSLTSEAMAEIAKSLTDHGIRSLSRIVLDDSYLDSDISVDGRSDTSNPYDAQNASLIANFNTVAITVAKGGVPRPGEPQTPLTETARTLARGLKPGTYRLNLGLNRQRCVRYFGELLVEFLKQEGLRGTPLLELDGREREGDRLLLRYHSRQSLAEIIRSMLKYSTNLVANQLLLALGAAQFHPPGTIAKGVRVVSTHLKERVHWQNFQLVEGSGLSRQNQVTPREMVALVAAFAPYEELLPIDVDTGARIKTGTINGVNTIVGSLATARHGTVRFAILVNSDVPFAYKFQLLRELSGLVSQ